jgi:phosphomannomutase
MNVADLRARVEQWILDDLDAATQDELTALLSRLPAHPAEGDPIASDLAERFAGSLAFGTAGLRGILGAGPNRMNRAVVARATWAVARELLASVPRAPTRPVIVGYDARRMSRELAEDVACIFGGAGMRVLLFPDPVPTPLVGFAVKRLEAAGGVVVTASHNPPEYNGYKVYWGNAAQVVPPADARIADAIERAPPARQVPRPPAAALRERGTLVDAPTDIEREYLSAIRSLAVHPTGGDRAFPIVYTPLHGVGNALARRALEGAGFGDVVTVPEQEAPDGAFPTVAFPNPEEPGAMDLAFAQASKRSAALVLANDPDADRLAVGIPSGAGGYRRLTGNELGVLLGHYLLTERASSRPRAVVATIVSSPMLGRIARDLGVHYEETLTGFKWIADRAVALEQGGYEFVFGFEEALGYCIGSAVHDKDGISAAVLAAELTAVLRSRGQTLSDAIDAIASRWGAFASSQINFTRPGASGVLAIQSAIDGLRAAPPHHIGGVEVVAVADYAAGIRRDRVTGIEVPLALPKSPVLSLELAAGAPATSSAPRASSASTTSSASSGPPTSFASFQRIVLRPSGTEPKAKVYFDVCEEVRPGEPVTGAMARANASIRHLEASFRSELLL